MKERSTVRETLRDVHFYGGLAIMSGGSALHSVSFGLIVFGAGLVFIALRRSR